MVCAFSKYVRIIKGKQSKLNYPLIEVGSTFICLIWSNGIHVGMMCLIVSSCQRNILSHGPNSHIDGFRAMFNIEHQWASNEACNYSLSCSFTWSFVSSIFWCLTPTPKYAMYLTFLKWCYT
jgi:hypothetical protein